MWQELTIRLLKHTGGDGLGREGGEGGGEGVNETRLRGRGGVGSSEAALNLILHGCNKKIWGH